MCVHTVAFMTINQTARMASVSSSRDTAHPVCISVQLLTPATCMDAPRVDRKRDALHAPASTSSCIVNPSGCCYATVAFSHPEEDKWCRLMGPA